MLNFTAMIAGLKGGIAVFIEQLHSAFPLFHEKVFGSFSTAHPKIDMKRNVMVSWISHAVLQKEGELARVCGRAEYDLVAA
jgi:hypothetical protein